jgi:hypothetical protein
MPLLCFLLAKANAHQETEFAVIMSNHNVWIVVQYIKERMLFTEFSHFDKGAVLGQNLYLCLR